MNCWEFMKCGRGPDAPYLDGNHPCPVVLETSLDGVHGGSNAGRACWVVAGTMCGGDVQGTFAKKCPSCIECDFYKMVEQELGHRFLQPKTLLRMIGEHPGPFHV